jgi:hypothetical protein
MKKQILSEEFRKMKKLAGITTENASGNIEMNDKTFKKINNIINSDNELSANLDNFIDSADKIMTTVLDNNDDDYDDDYDYNIKVKDVYNYLFTILENEL